LSQLFFTSGEYSEVILSSLAWKALGSPKVMLATNELLDFRKRPGECLGIIPHFHIMLGGNTILVDLLVVPSLLDFILLLGCDYVYAMNVVVSTLFDLMHFPHSESIVTIDWFSYDTRHPISYLAHISPLFVSIVKVNSSPPRVNYVVSYPRCSIVSEKGYLYSIFSFLRQGLDN
jgi:hypothetical protein